MQQDGVQNQDVTQNEEVAQNQAAAQRKDPQCDVLPCDAAHEARRKSAGDLLSAMHEMCRLANVAVDIEKNRVST
jgi:hypothetical protein